MHVPALLIIADELPFFPTSHRGVVPGPLLLTPMYPRRGGTVVQCNSTKKFAICAAESFVCIILFQGPLTMYQCLDGCQYSS